VIVPPDLRLLSPIRSAAKRTGLLFDILGRATALSPSTTPTGSSQSRQDREAEDAVSGETYGHARPAHLDGDRGLLDFSGAILISIDALTPVCPGGGCQSPSLRAARPLPLR